MSYKDASRRVLLEYRQSHSLAETVLVAKKMLESTTHKDDVVFHTHVHGEICETVLEILVEDYMQRFPVKTKDWFCAKGLIIKDINNPDSGYFTELDYTVFTPQKIFAFECKSYGGDKKITDICTIRKKKGGSFDVYAQHERHAIVLSEQLRPFRKSQYIGCQAYQLILFNFSVGETNDTRTVRNKLLMPCLDETNVLNIFSIYENDPEIWNMIHLRKAIKIIQKHGKENTKKHLAYVKDLKRNK